MINSPKVMKTLDIQGGGGVMGAGALNETIMVVLSTVPLVTPYLVSSSICLKMTM